MDKKKNQKKKAQPMPESKEPLEEPVLVSKETPSSPNGVQRAVDSVFQTVRRWSTILQIIVLLLSCLLAFTVRVFSVLRYESVIHEFDPWFNYRATKYLTQEGFYQFWNWFDSESWYPLGRVIGGTVFPGIMATAASIKWAGDLLAFPMQIRNVCVFLAPLFAGFTSIATFFFTKECTNRTETGLLAAFFIAIVPSYVSRSVAGSYDNEGVAIFALVFTFYFWVKAVNTGSILWSVGCVLAYFYMVAAWGGYSFIINIIPIFVAGTMFINKFSMKIYVAYSIFYVLGTIMAMLIPFVSFQAIESSEHLASHCVFFIMNVFVAVQKVKERLEERQFKVITKAVLGVATALFMFTFIFLTVTGATRFSGRSLTFLDPTYAKKYIPIIASVSEHQPTSWSSFFYDLQLLMIFVPVGNSSSQLFAGLFFCLKEKVTYGKLFVALYGMLSSYFACVMVRLMLVVAPAACVLAAIGISEIMRKMATSIRKQWIENQPEGEIEETHVRKGKFTSRRLFRKLRIPADVALVVIVFLIFNLQYYVYHATWISAEAYSNPSIVLDHKKPDGSRIMIDDYREAYYWLKQNTDEKAKILSWWDYGYQITGMANRTVIVDNNTWNNTHIAMVGLTMSSNEEEAYKMARYIGANYVLVIFGGLAHHGGDDISKFLWMVRIGGGVFPWIKENDYYGDGWYRVDEHVSPAMRECLMYKLSYYRFEEARQNGYDEMRQCNIGYQGFKLRRFREAFASQRWIVRIFEVKPDFNMGEAMIGRFDLEEEDRPLEGRVLIEKPDF